MKSRIVTRIGLLIAGVVFALAPAAARADFIFNLNVDNGALNPPNVGPYAQVTVHLTDATHATITFTSLTSGGNIYLMGGNPAVAVNVNATTWTIGNFAGANAGTGFTVGPLTDAGSSNVSTFGVFNQGVQEFDGFSHSLDTISFDLTNTSGTWGSDTTVLTPNSDGNLAAAHIFVTSSPADQSNGASITGFASGTQVVPAPPSVIVALSGVVLFGLIGLVSYRRRTQVMLAA